MLACKNVCIAPLPQDKLQKIPDPRYVPPNLQASQKRKISKLWNSIQNLNEEVLQPKYVVILKIP